MKCGQGSGITELARLSVIALLVGGRKAVILVFCRLSKLTVYEVRRRRGLAVFAGKPFITELLKRCAACFAALELGEGFYLRQPWGIVRLS